MAFASVLGLFVSLAATFLSIALFVRTWFGKVPHAISYLPVPLVLYNLWMSARFTDVCLRQFVLTAITPPAAMRLLAFVFLGEAMFTVGFLYGCVSVVHQLVGGRTARRVRLGAKYVALAFGALLVVGWSAYHFQVSSKLFPPTLDALALIAPPAAAGAWTWLLLGVGALPDADWRARVRVLARGYVALFAVVLVLAALRSRLWAASPVVPLAVDGALVLAYTLFTVVWVESVQRSARVASPA